MTAAAAVRTDALQVTDLRVRYGRVEVVHGVSFTAEPGAVTCLIGPNGAGKTTTLRMLLGLVRPTAGSALIHGVPYARLDQPARHVGAVLEARDRVTNAATGVAETLTSRRGVTLRRLERRGQTETRKARTRAERLIRRGERRVERETNAVTREANRRNNVVTQQVSTVSGRVEDAIQTGVAAGERVITNVQKQLA